MFQKLSGHKIAIVICLASVMLLTAAAYSFVYAPSMNSEEQTITSEEQLIAEIISQASEQEIYQTVYDLQNFETRVYGYPGNTISARGAPLI